MAQYKYVFLFIFVISATISSLRQVDALMLPNQPTPKPRHTKPSIGPTEPGSASLVTPASSPTNNNNKGVAEYRYVSKTGNTCILMKTDAVVEVKFKLHKLEEQADSFIPEKALVDGDCRSEDTVSIRISWTGYSLFMKFSKTPGGEGWYIEKIELTVNPDLPAFHGIQTHGKAIKLYHRETLIPTPVGRSYLCEELDVNLEADEDDHLPDGLRGSLLLRLLQVQAFMYKSENFEAPYECKTRKNFRDETTPIIVGSILAIAVLGTITGYGIFRYFKIKSVQYNTME